MPFSEAMYKCLGSNYVFVQTEQMEAERIQMGWAIDMSIYPYLKIAYENRKEDLFTVYAYSGLIEEYITVAGSKVNMQIAMSYDEKKDITFVYLATPFLNDGY